MQVDKEVLKIWLKTLCDLSITQVAKDIGVSKQTVYNAMNGKCSQKTHDKINNYILKRKRALTILLTD